MSMQPPAKSAPDSMLTMPAKMVTRARAVSKKRAKARLRKLKTPAKTNDYSYVRVVGDVDLAEPDIELGRDGSKWRHGWVPLNASATRIKLKKTHIGSTVNRSKNHEVGLYGAWKIPHPKRGQGHYLIHQTPNGMHQAVHVHAGGVAKLGRYDRPQDAEGAINAHIGKTRVAAKLTPRRTRKQISRAATLRAAKNARARHARLAGLNVIE